MKSEITFGGLTVAPGEKKSGFAPVLDTEKRMPLTVINGEKEGKTVLLTSGIHGGEYPGIACAMELAQQLDPKEISGQLIIFHPVNYSAFIQRRAYIVPEDGKNLNRQFPGDKDGTISQKMAYVLEHEYIRKADFHVDMHGGDIPEELAPYIYYAGIGDEKDVEVAKAVAEHTDFPYMVRSRATSGMYNYSTIIGTPSVLIELGDRGLWTREQVDWYRRNIENILRYLEVLPGEAWLPEKPALMMPRAEFLQAGADGCWYPAVQLGERIEQGQLLGVIKDVFGEVKEEIRAEFAGVVVFRAASLAIEKGQDVLTYGQVE